MGVARAVAGTFGIQPLDGAFGVPYQAAEPRDERLHPSPSADRLRNVTWCSEVINLFVWRKPPKLGGVTSRGRQVKVV